MSIISITVSPVNPFILTSSTEQFQAIAHFSSGPDLDVTTNPATVWASDTLSVATVDLVGLATSLTVSGSTTISATYGGKTGTSILKVGLANYTRIIEASVDATTDHNPIINLSTFNFSMVAGGVTLQNFTGSLTGPTSPIGWTIASGHPGDFTKVYIANEEEIDGYWVQLNNAGNATRSFSNSQRGLGVVKSICVDASGNQITSPGYPVLVQISGEAYVFATDPVNIGDFLIHDTNGFVKTTTFVPATPTPIIGYALEGSGATYPNMVLMRIQICGD